MMQAENRFTCDRCKVDVSVAVQNTPRRGAPPDGWTTLHVDAGIVPEASPLHLCPPCAAAFDLMMLSGR